MTTYTESQIKKAKSNYESFLNYESLRDYDVDTIGRNEATNRMEYHNRIVSQILGGNKELEREWKLWFLNQEVKKDRKSAERKTKKQKNNISAEELRANCLAIKKIFASR